MPRQIEIFNGLAVGDFFFRVEIQQIDQRAPFRVTGKLRQVVNLMPIDFPLVRKEEQVGVCTGDEQVPDRVLVVRLRPFEPFAPALLRFVFGRRSPLNIAVRTDRNDHRLFVDQPLDVEIAEFRTVDLGPALVGEFLFDLQQVLANDRQNILLVRKNTAKLVNVGQKRPVFVRQFFLFEIDQLTERHFENRVGLNGGQRIFLGDPAIFDEHGKTFRTERPFEQRRRRFDLNQPFLRLGLRFARANDADHLVDIGVGDEEPLNRMLTANRFVQEEHRPTANHRNAVTDKFLDHLLKGENPRLAVHQRQQNNREGILKRGVLIKLIQHHLRIGVLLEFQNQADRFGKVRFVPHMRDANDFSLVDQLGDFFLNSVAGLLIRDFRNDDPRPFPLLFNFGPRPNGDIPPAGQITAPDAARTAYHAAGRKIRPRTEAQKLKRRNVRIVDHGDRGVANFPQIVRRNARRHPDRDSIRAVDQKIRHLRRQDRRFEIPLIVGRNEINGVEIQVLQERHRHAGEPRLGISHGGGGKPGNRAEVPLLIDQHVTHIPFLRHSDQRRVDDRLTVRMVVSARIAGNFRAFDSARRRRKIQVVHGDQNTPLRRFEAVPDIRQRPADNHAHRVS